MPPPPFIAFLQCSHPVVLPSRPPISCSSLLARQLVHMEGKCAGNEQEVCKHPPHMPVFPLTTSLTDLFSNTFGTKK
eukprot:366050-Chlamydomonas_euryale.AAC.13